MSILEAAVILKNVPAGERTLRFTLGAAGAWYAEAESEPMSIAELRRYAQRACIVTDVEDAVQEVLWALLCAAE